MKTQEINKLFKALGLKKTMKGASIGGEWFAGSGDYLKSVNPTTGRCWRGSSRRTPRTTRA